MERIEELRGRRASLARDARAIVDGKNYGKRERDRVNEIQREIDGLDEQITRAEQANALSDRLEQRAASLSEVNGCSVDENAARILEAKGALRVFAASGPDKLSERQHGLMRPKNVASGTNSAGGYMVPTILMPTLIEKLKAYGGMRRAANVIETKTGNPLAWATVDGTAQAGELLAENTPVTTADFTFGSVVLTSYKFSSKTVPVSFEVLQDSAIDVEAFLLGALATRIARGQNAYFTTGSGASQPQGALTAASLGVTTASPTTFTYAELVALVHALDPAYRNNPGCAFMMNDAAVMKIRQLVDGVGRPLFLTSAESGLRDAAGAPIDSLFGYPLVVNQDMPSMAANAKPILFGDFGKYTIRDVMETQVFRFTDSAYVSKGQIGFMAWARADGRLIDASNASLQYLQMHS